MGFGLVRVSGFFGLLMAAGRRLKRWGLGVEEVGEVGDSGLLVVGLLLLLPLILSLTTRPLPGLALRFRCL